MVQRICAEGTALGSSPETLYSTIGVWDPTPVYAEGLPLDNDHSEKQIDLTGSGVWNYSNNNAGKRGSHFQINGTSPSIIM